MGVDIKEGTTEGGSERKFTGLEATRGGRRRGFYDQKKKVWRCPGSYKRKQGGKKKKLEKGSLGNARQELCRSLWKSNCPKDWGEG